MKTIHPLLFAGAIVAIPFVAAPAPQTSLPGHDECPNPLNPPQVFEAEGAFENATSGAVQFIDVDNVTILAPGAPVFDQASWDIYVTHWSNIREDDPDALNPRMTLLDWYTGGATDPMIWGYMANRGLGTQGWNAGTFGVPVKGDRLQMKVTGQFSGTPDITWKIIGYAYPK